MRFHLGQVSGGQPAIAPTYPEMPFAHSDWVVTQWNQTSYLNAEELRPGNSETRDPHLGVAKFSFTTPDHHSHVWIYQDQHSSAWVYELDERGGTLTPAGGSNLFLSSSALSDNFTLDKEIDYQVDAKISHASIAYFTPAAKTSGVVLAQVFTGFGAIFRDPRTGKQQHIFLQIPMSNSRDKELSAFRMCVPDNSNGYNLLYSGAVDSSQTLAFKTDREALHPLHYILNRYVADMVATPFTCRGRLLPWLAEARDLKNWHLGEIYIGLEIEAADVRPAAANHAPQGEVEVAMRIANLRVMRNPDRPFNAAPVSIPSARSIGQFCNPQGRLVNWQCGAAPPDVTDGFGSPVNATTREPHGPARRSNSANPPADPGRQRRQRARARG
jgi:hypothetical protein